MSDVRTLLVMTDERQKAVMPYLPSEEGEIRLASNCRQARELLRREHFDVVLTDMSLPDGNWLTISRESNQADLPPALVVCLPRQAERLTAILGAGHVQVLMPPWESQTIRVVLKEALGTAQVRTEPLTPESRVMSEPRRAPLPA